MARVRGLPRPGRRESALRRTTRPIRTRHRARVEWCVWISRSRWAGPVVSSLAEVEAGGGGTNGALCIGRPIDGTSDSAAQADRLVRIRRIGLAEPRGVDSPIGADDAVVSVRDLRKRYGSVEAVAGIDLEVRRGEILAFLGPNGAGKTTTVEILEGFRGHPSGGDVSVLGVDPAHGDRDWRDRLGVVLQESAPEPGLSVRECLGAVRRVSTTYRPIDETISLVGLDGKSAVRGEQLSGGQRRRLDVALALIGDPDSIFLDEPTTGFDPSARRTAWDVISGLRELGKTVFLTTHYMDEAEHLADRIAVIANGVIVATGTPQTLGGRDHMPAVVRFSLPSGIQVADLPAALQPRCEMHPAGAVMMMSELPLSDLGVLAAWAGEGGFDLPDLDVRRPSLEDVYLSLTDARSPLDRASRPCQAGPADGRAGGGACAGAAERRSGWYCTRRAMTCAASFGTARRLLHVRPADDLPRHLRRRVRKPPRGSRAGEGVHVLRAGNLRACRRRGVVREPRHHDHRATRDGRAEAAQSDARAGVGADRGAHAQHGDDRSAGNGSAACFWPDRLRCTPAVVDDPRRSRHRAGRLDHVLHPRLRTLHGDRIGGRRPADGAGDRPPALLHQRHLRPPTPTSPTGCKTSRDSSPFTTSPTACTTPTTHPFMAAVSSSATSPSSGCGHWPGSSSRFAASAGFRPQQAASADPRIWPGCGLVGAPCTRSRPAGGRFRLP